MANNKAIKKMSLTAGLLAASIPATSEGQVISVGGLPVSSPTNINQVSLLNNGFRFLSGGSEATAWDIDGDGNAEFMLGVQTRNSTLNLPGVPGGGSYQLALFFGSSSAAGPLNGRGLVGSGGVVAPLNQGFNVGPTLAAGYSFVDQDFVIGSALPALSAVNSNSANFAPLDSGLAFVFGTNNTTSAVFTSINNQNTSANFQSSFINFQAGSNFVGFRFDQNGELLHGWAEFVFDGQDPSTPQLTISRWAYQASPDASIAVGAVPEPNALMLLAMGAAGLLTLRRKSE